MLNETLKERTRHIIVGFFNSMSCFRFTLLTILFFYLPSLNFIVWVFMFLWSVYLFFKKLIKPKYIARIRYRKIIYTFLISGLITVIIHYSSNLFMNLFMLYWTALCFFAAYGLHSEQSFTKSKREMIYILRFIMLATSAFMLVGLGFLVIFPKGIKLWGYNFSIYENRFVGIMTNANVLAFYACIAVLCCHILWRIDKLQGTLVPAKKFVYISCGVINIISVFLSDSNAALMFMITYICFLAFYRLFKNQKKGKILEFVLRFISLIVICTITAAILLFIRTSVQSCVSLMLTSGESKTQITNSITTNNGSVQIKDDVKPDLPTTFEHQNTNIDSGRFTIWKQAAGLFEKFPIMGIGQANIVSYGERYLGGLKYSDFHNGLLTILISFGLVGFNIFIIFAITVAKAMLKAIFLGKNKCRKDGDILVLIVAFCAAYCVYSMFEVVLLMRVEYRVFIFWIMIGYGMSYAFRYKNYWEKPYRQSISKGSYNNVIDGSVLTSSAHN